jgi:class 3 adenylate cyclase
MVVGPDCADSALVPSYDGVRDPEVCVDSMTTPAPAMGPLATVHSLRLPAFPRLAGGMVGPALGPRRGNDDAPTTECRRLLLTLLFTDIVGSTRVVERLGDRAWRVVLGRHREIVRAHVARAGGVQVDCCGDGFFAVFPGPALAIDCAAAICIALSAVDIEIRAGVHAGECDLEDSGCVSGIAVHVAARIASVARPGEVLVSDTVRDLVAGSDLGFSDRGRRTLKGLNGTRRLFALNEAACSGARTLVTGHPTA